LNSEFLLFLRKPFSVNIAFVIELINNAALLISLGLVYDIFYRQDENRTSTIIQIFFGLSIGLISIVLMSIPAKFAPGVIFDTRTILVCVTGLYFGPVTTVIAILIAAAYRFNLGGVGTIAGIATIITAGATGILWNRYRGKEEKSFSLKELYAFGLTVHVIMLTCMFLLPSGAIQKTIRALVVPAIVIYPIGTMLLGNLLSSRKKRILSEKMLKAVTNHERELADVVRDAPIAIAYEFPEGSLKDCNASFADLTGYSIEELQAINWNDVLTPEKWRAFEKEKLGQLSLQNKSIQYEKEYIHKSGRIVPIELTVTGRFDSDGNFINYISFILDISRRKKFEEEQKLLESQLRQKYKMEAVGVMAGGMAHNFNNSLSIVLGNLELLNYREKLTDAAKEFVQNAQKSVLSSRDLIQQIMTYSRSGPSKLLPMQLSLVVNDTQKLLKSTIPSSVYIQYNVTHEGQNATILANAIQIQEALLNLCNNAVHAMDEKGTLSISLDTVELQRTDISPEHSYCSPGRFVCLSVKDTGCGMTSELITRIFDPFYTTKGVGEGTGMGLSTVQGMINQVGGLIKVRSSLGQGTTFDLFFPITDQVLSSSIDKKEQQIPTGTEQILLVDDDEMLASLVDRMLSDLGYHVTTMTSSAEALKFFTTNADSFDLVLTDQTMPDLLGSDLLQEMIKIKPDMPRILCTGYSSKISAEEAKKLSVSAFLIKPFEHADLARAIRKALDNN
jgi:PAS domain S-box-containing protein